MKYFKAGLIVASLALIVYVIGDYYFTVEVWGRIRNPIDKVYDEAGNLEGEGTLIDGFTYGYWIFYYPDGKIRARGYFNENVHEDGLWHYYEKERCVVFLVKYDNGVPIDTLK